MRSVIGLQIEGDVISGRPAVEESFKTVGGMKFWLTLIYLYVLCLTNVCVIILLYYNTCYVFVIVDGGRLSYERNK